MSRKAFRFWFLPRNVRRGTHSVGYAKRAVTPKPLRAGYYVRHPVGTTTSAVTRRALGYGRRKRR